MNCIFPLEGVSVCPTISLKGNIQFRKVQYILTALILPNILESSTQSVMTIFRAQVFQITRFCSFSEGRRRLIFLSMKLTGALNIYRSFRIELFFNHRKKSNILKMCKSVAPFKSFPFFAPNSSINALTKLMPLLKSAGSMLLDLSIRNTRSRPI